MNLLYYMYAYFIYLFECSACSENKRSFRGPGGVGRGLDSATAPKSVRSNYNVNR